MCCCCHELYFAPALLWLLLNQAAHDAAVDVKITCDRDLKDANAMVAAAAAAAVAAAAAAGWHGVAAQ
jgi:hypothetical protein